MKAASENQMSELDSREFFELIKRNEMAGLRKALLERSASVNCLLSVDADCFPRSLLQAASELGALNVIAGLVSDGANLEYSKHYGTPLDCAVAFDQSSAVELLLKLGANPNVIGPSEFDGDSKWTPLLKKSIAWRIKHF